MQKLTVDMPKWQQFGHCNECGLPFDKHTTKPRYQNCGHNICEKCCQSLPKELKFCVFCTRLKPLNDAPPRSEFLLEAMRVVPDTKKRVPQQLVCNQCRRLTPENEMTICHTCSKWNVGDRTAQITDFAARPISKTMCYKCSKDARHQGHEIMPEEYVYKRWNYPESIKYMKGAFNMTQMRVNWLKGSTNTLNELGGSMNEAFHGLEQRINDQNFSFGAVQHIVKALNTTSEAIRAHRTSFRKAVADARVLDECLGTLLEYVEGTAKDNGRWHPVDGVKTETQNPQNLLKLMEDHIKEMKSALPPVVKTEPADDSFSSVLGDFFETTPGTSRSTDHGEASRKRTYGDGPADPNAPDVKKEVDDDDDKSGRWSEWRQ